MYPPALLRRAPVRFRGNVADTVLTMNTPRGKQQEDPTGHTIQRSFNAGIVAGASFLVGGAFSHDSYPKSPWTHHFRFGMATGALGLAWYSGLRAFSQDNPYDGAALAMTSGSMVTLSLHLERAIAKPTVLARQAATNGLAFVGIYGLCYVFHDELFGDST